jgi:hypothetical protein
MIEDGIKHPSFLVPLPTKLPVSFIAIVTFRFQYLHNKQSHHNGEFQHYRAEIPNQ